MKQQNHERKETVVADPGLYSRIIENYFTTKIQRLASVPAEPPFLYLSEMGIIHEWHERQIPLEVIFLAIDRAFEEPATAPMSLQECSRLVNSEYEEWLKKHRG
jgi:hypothetical protein